MKNDILNFLEIQGYKLVSVEENNDSLIVSVLKKGIKDICPLCGRSRKISIHAKGKWSLKKHSNFQEKQIYLKVQRNRLICLRCKKVFSEYLPGIDLRFRKTNNFVKQSLKYLSKNSFNEVANVNACSYSSLKKQLYSHVNPYRLLDEAIKSLNELKEVYLGFDGQSFRGQEMVLTITELKTKKVITVLPSEHKRDLIKFLEYLPLDLRLQVKGISVDMTNKNKYVLEQYFPNALIVIDHFHVVSCAIRAVQNLRRTIQSVVGRQIDIKKLLDKSSYKLSSSEKNTLIRYFMEYPEIKEAYLLKERVVNLYKIRNPRKAEHKFRQIIFDLSNSKEDDLKELGRTLKRWDKKILNYFQCRITNAFTEGIHTKCKLIKRKSYGFRNVETYVRKLILGLLPFITIISLHT